MWTSLGMFLMGVALGVAMTWWRWRTSLEILDRSTEWRTVASEVKVEIESQKRYAEAIDLTVGRLADYVRAHIRITTPEHMRGVIAKMVGETSPEPPKAGWDEPLPKFEEGISRQSRRNDGLPRGR